MISKKLFIDELQDIYSAEIQIVKALPKMINAVQYPELKEALTAHLEETKNQVTRLDRIFSKLGESAGSETCEAMKGLIEESDEYIKKYPESIIRDAALITAAQRIEHYEMAVYGALRTFAKELEYDDAADLLQETLDEEGNANNTLTGIAEGGFFTAGVNEKALKRK